MDDALAQSLERGGWRLVERIDLGTTSSVLLVEVNGERQALKLVPDGDEGLPALRREHRLLRYLNRTPVRSFVPRVGAWIPELPGFAMEVLRHPTPEKTRSSSWMPDLARALRALHAVDPPPLPELEDDRPDLGQAVTKRLGELFEVALRTEGFWDTLSEEDRARLARVRAHYDTYAALLAPVAEALTEAKGVLTHGDLSGDNLMTTEDGRPRLVDWGAARVSAALTDVASLCLHAHWAPDERRRFYELYLANRHEGPAEDSVALLELLHRVYGYRSCVKSLLWLDDETQGLDAVGRDHFDRQLAAL